MQLRDFIVCDDIRREASQKTILVGVYDDDTIIITPNVKGLPIALPLLTFYVRFRLSEKDEALPLNFDFSINFDAQGSTPLSLKGTFRRNETQIASLIVRVLPLVIPYTTTKMDCKITFTATDGNTQSFDLESIKIKINEVKETIPS
jgi:hypothetical protein